MKYMIAVVMPLLLVAAAAFAGPTDRSERRASEVMFPIDHDGYRSLFEGFEGTLPPSGWTLSQTNANQTWFQDCGLYGTPYEGSCNITCLYDDLYSGSQDEWLHFDYTLEAGDECLSFYAYGNPYWAVDPYQNYNLLVTVNDQIVWDYYNDNDGAVIWQWQQYSVDLTRYGTGQTITIGFGYQGYDGAQGSVDAIEIGPCPDPPPEPCCPSEYICYIHDWNVTSCGWNDTECGAGPIPWEWGVATGIPTVACDDVAVTKILATNLVGDYPVQTGQGAVVGPFAVTANCHCLELCHFYDIETGYDGGNVKVSSDGGTTWTLVHPFGGYDDVLDSTSYTAECVAGEEVFTGHMDSFQRDCFDLTQYIGQNVMIGFFFGSDSSVTYPGWYVKWVKFGSDMTSPVQDSSWSGIKAIYR